MNFVSYSALPKLLFDPVLKPGASSVMGTTKRLHKFMGRERIYTWASKYAGEECLNDTL